MEVASNEDLQNSATTTTTASNDADHHEDSVLSDALNHVDTEPKLDVSEKEAISMLELIAATGKFWHEWDKLKAILSFQLKQVLSEYPEAKVTSEEQDASLGETSVELVKRLDEALHSFDHGPPFTLQRLCEILLDARGIYPKLSKLALALEKNLLVTSMLTISTDLCLQSPIEPKEPEKDPDSASNGGERVTSTRDRDEVMTEVEEADIDDNMTINMDAFEEIVGPSETNPEPSNN